MVSQDVKAHPSAQTEIERAEISPVPVGYFYTWWRGDPLPALNLPLALEIGELADPDLLASIARLNQAEIARRIERGHKPWLARLRAETVGWGWVATREATIGGLDVTLSLPAADRYLWDFETLPKWRRRGIYSALLQAMVKSDPDIERYWIGHDRANHASMRGILRAGFERIGAVHPTSGGGQVYVPHGRAERAHAAATLLGLPVAELPGA